MKQYEEGNPFYTDTVTLTLPCKTLKPSPLKLISIPIPIPMNLPPPKPTPTKGECGNCRSNNRWFFHRLSIRGMDRRVCTSCVLRLHPSFFCPSCFEFFDSPLSNASSSSSHRFISCTKCSSLTHLRCLPSPPPTAATFLCPPCSQPGFSFFSDSDSINKRRALILLCACKVAAASVAKSLAVARARVEKTVRDAALARKRARDALDVCSVLEKVKRIDGVSNSTRSLGTNHNYNHNHNHNNNVVSVKEEMNGFIGQGQGQSNNKVQGSSRVVDVTSKIL